MASESNSGPKVGQNEDTMDGWQCLSSNRSPSTTSHKILLIRCESRLYLMCKGVWRDIDLNLALKESCVGGILANRGSVKWKITIKRSVLLFKYISKKSLKLSKR